ncbi:MAG TPA: hypothetical protein VID67_10935 [Rhizomicrobium sp.]
MINPLRTGLVFGIFLALYHACWAALVAAGLAQMLIDFVFWAHFITPPYHIEAFTLGRAGILIGLTFGVGLVGGFVGALVWNAFHGDRDMA